MHGKAAFGGLCENAEASIASVEAGEKLCVGGGSGQAFGKADFEVVRVLSCLALKSNRESVDDFGMVVRKGTENFADNEVNAMCSPIVLEDAPHKEAFAAEAGGYSALEGDALGARASASYSILFCGH